MKSLEVLYDEGTSETRHWGKYDVLVVGEDYVVKKITVLPHKSLSLQSHEYRDELWIVVKGKALFVVEDEQFEAEQNQTCIIKRQQKHRMANQTDEVVEVIEVQTGDRLDEKDIIRYQIFE